MNCSSLKKEQNLSFLLLLSTILAFQFTLSAQTKSLNKINRGLNELYNFQFNLSDKDFEDFIKLNPDHPGGYYFKSIKNLWFYLDNKSEEYLTEFINYTDTAISRAEDFLQKDSINVFIYYILCLRGLFLL